LIGEVWIRKYVRRPCLRSGIINETKLINKIHDKSMNTKKTRLRRKKRKK